MIVDFHAHTRESDGSLTPQALVDFMRERRVEIFAISDHDSLAAFGKFELPTDARVVTGVEINTTHRGHEVHILGYGVALDDPTFDEFLATNRVQRRARIERMVTQLQAAGYAIDLPSVLAEADPGAALGRPHVAKALIRSGQGRDIEGVFRELLRSGKPGYVPSVHVTPVRAIEAILTAGGLPVLAHPGRLHDRGIVAELLDAGLRGIEVFYPKHDAADIEEFREMARRYGLVMSAGSDFHDLRYHVHGVGMDIDAQDVGPFLDALGCERLC